MLNQKRELEKRPHVLVATPGRLADLVRRMRADLHASHLRFLVLDEADRLFEPCFARDIALIMEQLPPLERRQTLMFSATITKAMLESDLNLDLGADPDADAGAGVAAGGAGGKAGRAVTAADRREGRLLVGGGKGTGRMGDEDDGDDVDGEEKGDEDADSAAAAGKGEGDAPVRLPAMLRNPVFLQVSTAEDAVVDTLRQEYLFLPQAVKETYLAHLLRSAVPDHPDYVASRSFIVFVSTCAGAEFLSQVLVELRVSCVALHSRLNQARRLASLAKFRSGLARVLVATDVASRGLDIPSVQVVINYDVPRVVADYIHRVGRTARAGRSGLAITLVSQYDIAVFKQIEESLGRQLPVHEVSESKVLEGLKGVTEAKKMAKIKLFDYRLSKGEFAAQDVLSVDDGSSSRRHGGGQGKSGKQFAGKKRGREAD